HLAQEWRTTYGIDEFSPEVLDAYADRVESQLSVARLPGAPPPSSAVLERGATKLGWRNVEFARVFSYDEAGRGTKQTMSRTMLPRARAAGATILPDCRVVDLVTRGDRVVAARCRRTHPGGGVERLTIHADHVFVCCGAVHTPALLQRSGIRRNVGNGLKMHPTIKVAARFPHPVDHGDVPMHRVTEFSPFLAIGRSASRRGQVAMALAEADLSRLARGLVHLGELLLAAGAIELHPSVTGGRVVRRLDELGTWWDQVTRSRANLMTVHLTSSLRMGEDRRRTGTDSFGR